MNPFRRLPVLTPVVFATLLLASCGGDDDAPPADTSCQAIASDGTTVVVGSGLPGDPSLPEAASGYRTGLKAVYAHRFMVTSSNAFASAAGCTILQKGGSAADAAVAVQAVLGLTVPEATGLGSGGFMLYYDAKAKTVQTYDGRESAPATASENYLRWIDDATDHTTPKPSARASGRSIGTIGVPRLIEAVQKDHGKLVWKDLFADAIALSTNGFKIGGRLAAAISSNATSLKRDAEATAYFFNADGSPKALGTVLTNPAYAASLTAFANGGADAIMTGPIAQDIVAKIATTTAVDGSPITPGKTTLADLAAYQAKKRDPVCTTYRSYWVCGMGPPTSGGITVASALGILENFNLELHKPTAIDLEGGKPTVIGVHLISEAERLAYADRDKYVADTDFVPLPGGSVDTMLNKPYLQSRAGLISFNASMGTAAAGNLGPVLMGIDSTEEHGTNQFTIVDGDGSVLTATTTVESSMGSFHMTHGFLLNNQLTDFSAAPTDGTGAPDRQPGRAQQAAAQLDGADPGVSHGRRRQQGRFPDGHRLAGRRHDPAVRSEDAGRRARLGPRRAAVVGPGRLRREQQPDHLDRRRAPERQHRQQRRQRPADHRPARARPHDLDRRAVERRQHDHARAGERRAGAGRRHRSAPRGRRPRRHLRAVKGTRRGPAVGGRPQRAHRRAAAGAPRASPRWRRAAGAHSLAFGYALAQVALAERELGPTLGR